MLDTILLALKANQKPALLDPGTDSYARYILEPKDAASAARVNVHAVGSYGREPCDLEFRSDPYIGPSNSLGGRLVDDRWEVFVLTYRH